MEALETSKSVFAAEILDPFINIFEKHINRNAFCINEQFYSYRTLALIISGIRKSLRQHNLLHKYVGILANDDIETYASIIAVWLEGGSYVPLHPMQPAARNNEIIEQADLSVVLSSDNSLSFNVCTTIKTRNLISEEVNLNPVECPDESPAYMLFTSGSTGKPKGVPITRGNIGTFMRSFWKVGFEINESDRCLQCFDLTFDVSVQSYLVPLTRGACTYTIPHNQIKYSYVYGLLEDHKLTFGAMAPSMIRYLRPYFSEINAPDMRYCILTAEASPVDLVTEWSACIPNAEIYDFYGPTEATIYCTYYRFSRNGFNKHFNGMLSVGKPMIGINAIITDDDYHLLGPGEKGQLCISGRQLTPGYWKNQEKTAQAFFELNINNRSERFYKTGDLCIMDEWGDILYGGRLDYQVKIQGYRIELGEIEYHARQFLQGGNAVASTYENKSGVTEIVLFVEDKETDPEIISSYLKSTLPYYMVPSKFVFRETFPLNNNGKIDRIKLKESI
jgi:amino acid adenylation domain-containing protein